MGKDVAVRKPTLPANWQEQLRADAAAAKEAEKGVGLGQFVSVRGGVLSFQGTPMPGNKMRCVVLASTLLNAYYEGEFDADAPSSPVCFAFGKVEAGMAPHETSPKPQHEDCATCEKNKFGSAEQGRGKACKNGRRLGLVHVDDLKKDLPEWQVAFLQVPPTSLPSWATYVRSLDSQLSCPPYAVVTEVSTVPDPKSVFKVLFTLVEVIKDKKALGAVFAKAKEVAEAIAFPFQPAEAPAAAAKKARKPEATAKRAGKSGFGGAAAKPAKF